MRRGEVVGKLVVDWKMLFQREGIEGLVRALSSDFEHVQRAFAGETKGVERLRLFLVVNEAKRRGRPVPSKADIDDENVAIDVDAEQHVRARRGAGGVVTDARGQGRDRKAEPA